MFKRQQLALLANKKHLIVLLLTVWSITGCSFLYHEKFKEPEFDLRGSKILIPDFAFENPSGTTLWHYESKDGALLARFIRVAMQEGACDLDVYTGKKVDQMMIESFADSSPDWQKWGKKAEADYIMRGKIRELTYNNKRVIGVSQGNMMTEIKIWSRSKIRANSGSK